MPYKNKEDRIENRKEYYEKNKEDLAQKAKEKRKELTEEEKMAADRQTTIPAQYCENCKTKI